MGSKDESHKHSNLDDPSSSPTTQPLLSKPTYPFPSLHNDSTKSEPDQIHYLQISYNYGPRPIKDLPFLILFALFVLSTFAFGIFASVNRNRNSSSLSFVYDSKSSSCVQQSSSFSSPNPLLLDRTLSWYYSSSPSVSKNSIWTLVITLILSVPFPLCVPLLLKHYAKQVVYVPFSFFVIVLISTNAYWFVACTVNSACRDAFPLVYRLLLFVFVFLMVGVIVWIFVVNWNRIESSVTIIGIASNALLRNLGLFCVLPALTLGLFVYYATIVVFLVLATQNGKIVVREGIFQYYCAWQQDSWVPAYYALAILTMLWSAVAMVEAQAYVISGTIAQWYFSIDPSTPRSSVRSSLRNALGPSSGTVCLSGLLVCVVRVVRAAVAVNDSAGQEAPGMLNRILRCCFYALLTAIDFVTKSTMNFAAITGEAYCSSAWMTYELLKRNLLSAVFLKTVSTGILAGMCLVLSAIYGVVVYAILNAVSNLGEDSYYLALMAWVLLIVVLGFFVHVLDNVIHTVYVCSLLCGRQGKG